MSSDDPAQLRRLRGAVFAVLGGLVVATLLAWGLELWPAPLVRNAQMAWFGRVGGRSMFVGIFTVYGLILLAVLAPAAALRLLYDRIRGA